MTREEALLALKDARSKGLSWVAIAEILVKARDSGASGKAGQLLGDFMAEAAAQSGYAAILLRRMVPAFLFLQKMEEKYPEHDFRAGMSTRSGYVGKIECIQRLAQVDEELACKLLLNAHELGYKKLETIYRNAIGAKPEPDYVPIAFRSLISVTGADSRIRLGKRYRHPFYIACWVALGENLSTLCNETGLRLAAAKEYNYIAPFAIAIALKDLSIRHVDCFQPMMLASTPTSTALQDILKEATYTAQFFRHLWIITPPQDEPSQELISALAELGLTSVGYAQLVAGNFKIIVAPTSEQHGPLVHKMMEEVLEKAVSTI